jgi:hypothetical protein
VATTSQQLDDFAAKCEAADVWTADLQTELMDLIREPVKALQGWDLPANDRTKAMDNIYRCKPRGWTRAEQELGMDAKGQPQGGVASFALWELDQGDPYPGLRMEVGIQKPCRTMALAMLSATARVWAYLLRQAGR